VPRELVVDTPHRQVTFTVARIDSTPRVIIDIDIRRGRSAPLVAATAFLTVKQWDEIDAHVRANLKGR